MNYIIKDSTLTDIADSIREKTGGSDFIPVSEMAALISTIRTNAVPILESITITPTGIEINEIPPFGSDGFGMVTVTGDANLISENIKTGVAIYGVEGSLANDNGGIDTSDATATASDILDAATAYVKGKKIRGTHVCEADPILSELYVMPTGKEFTEIPPGDVHGFSEVTVEGDENLIPENILAGTTIYGVDGNVAFQSVEYTPGRESKYLELGFGYSAFDSVYVEGDRNLLPENIIEGVSIFGVEGTAVAYGTDTFSRRMIEKEVTPTAKDIYLVPPDNYYGYSEVIVRGDFNLVPSNIVKGISIFGIQGVAEVVDEGVEGGDQHVETMFVLGSPKIIFEEKEDE